MLLYNSCVSFEVCVVSLNMVVKFENGLILSMSLFFALCAAMLTSASTAYASKLSTTHNTVTVITSNRPLALIAQQLLGESGSASSLLKAGQTPHDFALSFSDRSRIARADLILWIGEDIEPYLHKLVDNSAVKDLRLDRYWSIEGTQSHDHDHHHDAHHADHGSDVHFWMSPAHTITIARKLHLALTQLAPTQTVVLDKNLARLEQQITQTDNTLRQTLAYTNVRYGIAHNAYSHFIEHYNLPEPMLLSHSTESNPGIRKLMKIQQQLPEGSCVLVEPEHAQGWPRQLSQREGYRLTLIDSLASMDDYPSYADWLSTIAGQFQQCLSGA